MFISLQLLSLYPYISIKIKTASVPVAYTYPSLTDPSVVPSICPLCQ